MLIEQRHGARFLDAGKELGPGAEQLEEQARGGAEQRRECERSHLSSIAPMRTFVLDISWYSKGIVYIYRIAAILRCIAQSCLIFSNRARGAARKAARAQCRPQQAQLFVGEIAGSWRPRPELNRGTRFCRPLRNHSATWPFRCGAAETGTQSASRPLYRSLPQRAIWRECLAFSAALLQEKSIPQERAHCRGFLDSDMG